MNLNAITLNDWKQIGIQVLIGGVLGASATLAIMEDLNKALLIAIGIGFLKGVAQTCLVVFQPKTTAVSSKSGKKHWTGFLKKI